MIEEIQVILNTFLLEAKTEILANTSPSGLEVPKDYLVDVMQLLYEHEALYFDMLSCVTGIDNGTEANSMEVIYNLYSIPYDRSLTVKVQLDRNNPEVDSVGHIWQTANWHEREAFDLLGINFDNHPDLRRILLPNDWEGHPLRKDYKTQEYYHGVRVDYDDNP